jgi:hypothetical protein
MKNRGTHLTCSNVFLNVSDCGNLTVVDGNFDAPSGTTYGQEATQTCNIGYTFSGAETVKCAETGEWNASAAVCTIVGKLLIDLIFYHFLYPNVILPV